MHHEEAIYHYTPISALQISIVESTRPRWNFNKTNLPEYTKELDVCIRFTDPKAKNYHRFIGLVLFLAKKHVPRGFRNVNFPSWAGDSQWLYDDFVDSSDSEIGDNILPYPDSTGLNKYK